MARVALCQDTLIEYMGYMQMAAVLREEGHQVEVFFDRQLRSERFVDEVVAFAPDVVGFSALTPSREWAIATANRIGQRCDAVRVVGNVDAILNPMAYVSGGAFDLICTGEGEDALAELCQAIDDEATWTGIAGFWAVVDGEVHANPARAELVDMDALPLIDRSIYDKYAFFRRSPYLRVYAGRGCPFRCSFCSNTTMTDAYGGARRYLRKSTPEGFVEHIERLVASRPNRIRRIFIIDEVLWFDRAWLREFLQLYRDRVGIAFTMNFKFNGGVSEDDVALMAEAGAVAINVAAETGDEDLRRGLLNKPVSNAHILEVAQWMHRHGIQFSSSAFFGLPGQTFEGHLAELEFYRAVRPRYLWTTFFQPYPGLELTASLEATSPQSLDEAFDVTVHKDMYLDLPDRRRLVNLKKVYYLMYRYPRSQRPLAALCRLPVPILFDVLFLVPFLRLALWAEGCSVRQFLTHLRNFAINPAIRRNQPLNASGRPFNIAARADHEAEAGAPSALPPVDAQPVALRSRGHAIERAATVGDR